MNYCNNKYPEKKIKIFNAAIKLISENGFHGSPTSKIAKEAGIACGTLFLYFKNKKQLIEELFEYTDEQINSFLTEDFDPDSPPKEQFYQLCRRLIRFSFDYAQVASFFNQYIDSPYGYEMRKIKHDRDGDNIPKQTTLYPFYQVFNTAKNKSWLMICPISYYSP
jgi:AcrR family transcriptional regulator